MARVSNSTWNGVRPRGLGYQRLGMATYGVGWGMHHPASGDALHRRKWELSRGVPNTVQSPQQYTCRSWAMPQLWRKPAATNRNFVDPSTRAGRVRHDPRRAPSAHRSTLDGEP